MNIFSMVFQSTPFITTFEVSLFHLHVLFGKIQTIALTVLEFLLDIGMCNV